MEPTPRQPRPDKDSPVGEPPAGRRISPRPQRPHAGGIPTHRPGGAEPPPATARDARSNRPNVRSLPPRRSRRWPTIRSARPARLAKLHRDGEKCGFLAPRMQNADISEQRPKNSTPQAPAAGGTLRRGGRASQPELCQRQRGNQPRQSTEPTRPAKSRCSRRKSDLPAGIRAMTAPTAARRVAQAPAGQPGLPSRQEGRRAETPLLPSVRCHPQAAAAWRWAMMPRPAASGHVWSGP